MGGVLLTTPFISAADLAALLGLEEAEVTANPFTVIAIDAACERVRTYIGQTINLVEDDDVVLDARGGYDLLLPELPVVDVTAVSVDGEALTSAEWFFSEGGMLYRQNTDDPALLTEWPYGRANVEVTYSHGWSLSEPPAAGTARVPSDLRMVALRIAAQAYQSVGVNWGLKSETVGQYSYTIAENAEVGREHEPILDRYVVKRVPVA